MSAARASLGARNLDSVTMSIGYHLPQGGEVPGDTAACCPPDISRRTKHPGGLQRIASSSAKNEARTVVKFQALAGALLSADDYGFR
jgi:hypothetical protein